MGTGLQYRFRQYVAIETQEGESMAANEVKTYLTGLCLTALLSGASLTAPSVVVGASG